VTTQIHFFRTKSQEFIAQILHEIKPEYLGKNEIVYSFGEDAKSIYFLLEGRVTLYMDLIDYLSKDEDLLLQTIQRNEEVKARLSEKDKETLLPSVKGFIKYCSGSYFGDADFFGEYVNPDNKRIRDSTARTSDEVLLFSMTAHVLLKIKNNFDQVYVEMKDLGMRRFMNHQILIKN
jgi:CRP-like cAMP-binding protein